MDAFFNSLDTPSLTEDFRKELESPLTQEKISAAVLQMQAGKSSGLDAFPSEF